MSSKIEQDQNIDRLKNRLPNKRNVGIENKNINQENGLQNFFKESKMIMSILL